MPMIHFDLDELFEDLIPEEKSKKQNSTETKHINKFGRVSREVPQAQQPQQTERGETSQQMRGYHLGPKL